MKTRLIQFCCTGLVFFHVLMTLVYLSPSNLLKLSLGEFAYAYMNSLFYQNWHLFSPNPAISSTKLAIRCIDENGHPTAWKDPFASLLEAHQKTRWTGRGKVLMHFHDIADSLKLSLQENSADCHGDACSASEVQTYLNNQAQQLAERFSLNYCLTKHPERPVSLAGIQYKILEFFPTQFTDPKRLDKKWDKVVEIPFPPRFITH